MAFRITLLALFGLSSLPIPAQAVLNAAKASALDNNSSYSGCPAIGAGAGAPQPKLCGNLKTKEVYCSYYDSTPTLKGTSEVQAAKAACMAYFQAAIDDQQLICDYERDAKVFQDYGTSLAAHVDSAKGAEKGAASAARCASKIYYYYSDVSNDQLTRLISVRNASQQALRVVARKAGQIIESEVNCSTDGTPNAPPGYLMMGLAGAALDDQKKTYDRISAVMARFGQLMNARLAQSKQFFASTNSRADGLGAITASDDGIKSKVTLEDIENGNDKSESEGAGVSPKMPVKRFAKSIFKGTTKGTAQDSLISVARGEDVMLFDDLLVAGVGRSLMSAAEDNSYAFVLSLSVKYFNNGGLRAAEVATELAVFGISIVGGIIGAPALGVTVAGEVVSFIGEEIAKHWEAYDREVIKAFQDFSQPRVHQLSSVTSQQLAQAYKTQKLAYAYCSKCNLAEKSYGCPGFVGAQHGFNADFHSKTEATTAQPFSNPWLVKAYRQYQARPGASNGHDHFTGIVSVPPTSTAP